MWASFREIVSLTSITELTPNVDQPSKNAVMDLTAKWKKKKECSLNYFSNALAYGTGTPVFVLLSLKNTYYVF